MRIKLPQSRRGKVITVAILAVCAMAIFKPLGWIQYLLISTPFAVPALLLSCILPTLAAFVAGPVGAIIVSVCAVSPSILLYPFYYPPDPTVFFPYSIARLGDFAEIAVFACVFYSMGKRGGAKNLLCGLVCGVLDFMFIQIVSNCLTVLSIEKDPPISAVPGILTFFLALAAHVLVFLLRRREQATREE